MDIIKSLDEYEKELRSKYNRCVKVLSHASADGPAAIGGLIQDASAAPNPHILSDCDPIKVDVSIQEKRHGDKAYYYLRKNYGGEKLREEEYIPKNKKDYISRLLQTHYSSKVVPYYEKQLKIISQLRAAIEKETDAKFYEKLSVESKRFLSPIVPYKPDVINAWQSKPYKRNNYRIEEAIHDSLRGEKLRSKSEVLIANSLFHAGVPYFVEPKMQIGTFSFCPDFLILRLSDYKEIIWEHFGRMSDPIYADSAIRKIQHYEASGYHLGDNFIATFETEKSPLSSRMVDNYIDRIIKI